MPPPPALCIKNKSQQGHRKVNKECLHLSILLYGKTHTSSYQLIIQESQVSFNTDVFCFVLFISLYLSEYTHSTSLIV